MNGQKMSKISEKVQKIRDLEGPTAFRPFENTLYNMSNNTWFSKAFVSLNDPWLL